MLNERDSSSAFYLPKLGAQQTLTQRQRSSPSGRSSLQIPNRTTAISSSPQSRSANKTSRSPMKSSTMSSSHFVHTTLPSNLSYLDSPASFSGPLGMNPDESRLKYEYLADSAPRNRTSYSQQIQRHNELRSILQPLANPQASHFLHTKYGIQKTPEKSHRMIGRSKTGTLIQNRTTAPLATVPVKIRNNPNAYYKESATIVSQMSSTNNLHWADVDAGLLSLYAPQNASQSAQSLAERGLISDSRQRRQTLGLTGTSAFVTRRAYAHPISEQFCTVESL